MEQAATKEFFESLWHKRGRKEATIASLQALADAFQRSLSKATFLIYQAALADLTPMEMVTGCTRATLEGKYFPPPSTLRELSGRGAEREAAEALVYLLKGMRTKHGTRLLTLPGPLLRTEEEWRDGERFKHEILGDRIPFPLSQRLEDALTILGWGDKAKGIALLATHPAVSEGWNFDDEPFHNQPFRASDDLLRRWVEAYREAACQQPREN